MNEAHAQLAYGRAYGDQHRVQHELENVTKRGTLTKFVIISGFNMQISTEFP
jgi:hypothetical protein